MLKFSGDVASIGEQAFYDRTKLTSVTIPNSVTSIGEGAFYGCSGLTSIMIGNNVISIGSRAFMDCSSLTSVTIPNSVTDIEYEAFRCGDSGAYKGSLETITVGETVNTYDGYSQFFEIILGNGEQTELMMFEYDD